MVRNVQSCISRQYVRRTPTTKPVIYIHSITGDHEHIHLILTRTVCKAKSDRGRADFYSVCNVVLAACVVQFAVYIGKGFIKAEVQLGTVQNLSMFTILCV